MSILMRIRKPNSKANRSRKSNNRDCKVTVITLTKTQDFTQLKDEDGRYLL